MKVIWHATASVELENGSERLLFDPFVPLEGAEIKVDISEFDGFSDILITHGHFDHIINLPEIVSRNPQVKIYCTETPYKTLAGRGVPEANLRMIRPGEHLSINGFEITVFQSAHAILPFFNIRRILHVLASPLRRNTRLILREIKACPENGEIVAFHVSSGEKEVMILGSLNLQDDVQYVAGMDLLVLPYNGWIDPLPIADKVIERLKPKRVVLDHYDNAFPPFTIPLELDPILDKYPDRVSAMEIGRTEMV